VGSHPVLRVNGHLTPLSELNRMFAGRHHRHGVQHHERAPEQKFKDHFEIDLAYSVPAWGASASTSSSSAARSDWCCASSGQILTIEELLLPAGA